MSTVGWHSRSWTREEEWMDVLQRNYLPVVFFFFFLFFFSCSFNSCSYSWGAHPHMVGPTVTKVTSTGLLKILVLALSRRVEELGRTLITWELPHLEDTLHCCCLLVFFFSYEQTHKCLARRWWVLVVLFLIKKRRRQTTEI